MLHPLPENNSIDFTKSPISTIDIKLSSSLHFSDNFINCTHRKDYYSSMSRGYDKYANNELCKIHFVLFTAEYSILTVITQREVDNLRSKGV